MSRAVRSGWVSSGGPFVAQFETEFARYHDVAHCVALSNGTAALEVALHGIGIQPGDEVIIPSFTIMSVAIAVLRLGALPRLVDVDPESWTITAEGISAVLSEKSRAVIVVHGFGQPADMDPILALARTYGLKIVEDCAESIASRYKGRLCGTVGDVATFSFYGNKLITMGEGGCLITHDDRVADRARRYINLYFGLDERFAHDDLGYNFRLTNMQAAIGCAQLEQIEDFAKRKMELGRRYADALADHPNVEFQKTVGDVDHVYWMFCVVLRQHVKMDVPGAMRALQARGIETRNLFKGLHAQQPLQSILAPEDVTTNFPVTEHLYARGFYIPSGLNLATADLAHVVEALGGLR